MAEINSICVYCGSQPGNEAIFTEKAEKTGRIMAQAGVRLVYGGGNSGIMGAISSSVLKHGGNVLGIIPGFLRSHEGVHSTHPNYDLIVTETMHERKQIMFEQSDAFLTLPGGIGTLEEVVEVMTWAQLDQHEKPIGFLDVLDFWQPIFELLKHMRDAGFLHNSNRIQPLVMNNPEDVVETFRNAVSCKSLGEK